MPPNENWMRISTLLDAVLDLPPEERADYLSDACDDPALRAEVEALLAAEADAPSFLEQDAAHLATPLIADEDAPPEMEDEPIGPYRLMERIGQGGMSIVYLAERVDGHFEQQVALKLLPRYFETEDRIARFRAERHILAALDHPNIAHLLDGGVTDTGRPYLVMEHVEGDPITDYCTARNLPVETRLKLLQAVCRAVHHAHRRLVVHRDLKPSNILVTETEDGPRVKLLDFGIAKLLDKTSAWTQPVTRTGEHWMTPEYAAPEQVSGATISTATDVYQLGVLAYELLTGQRPFHLENKSLTEIEHIVLEVDPDRPSEQVDAPAERTRQLQGDLDTIVLKALRKEPERRYGSAEALADDLQRYLDGRPVDAQPATWRYRARKFARRNRGTVAMITLIALLLIGYAATITVQAERIAIERDRTAREADKAEQVSEFLVNLFEASDPSTTRGDTVTARQLLQRGVERAAALDDQPEVQAEMHSVIGRIYMQIGLYNKATPLLEDALDARRARYDEETSSEQLASSLHNLGSNYQALGRYQQAEVLYREALTIWPHLPEAERTDMVRTLNNLAGILRSKGDYDEALSIQRETITTARQLLGDGHPIVALALGNLAEIHHHQSNLQTADSLYQIGWSLGRRVLGEDHPHLLSVRSNQAELYRETGRLKQAERIQRTVLEIRENRYPDHQVRLGLSQTGLGHILRAQGTYEEAESLYRTALDNLRPNLPEQHAYIADALMGLGTTLTERGNPDQAEPLLRNSLSLYEELQPDSWQLAEVKSMLGRCLSRQERYAEAESLLLEGYAMLKHYRGRDDAYTRQAAQYLTTLYTAWKKPAEAAAYRSVPENGSPP